MKKFLQLLGIFILLAACTPDSAPQLEELMIETSKGIVPYRVESAQTPEEMKTGLMNRDYLAPDSGMIFKLDAEQQAVMWMKDTRIPLDMLFVDSAGNIIWIYENAEPYSEKYIISPHPSKAVLELNGGDVRKHGIKIGDKIHHQFLK